MLGEVGRFLPSWLPYKGEQLLGRHFMDASFREKLLYGRNCKSLSRIRVSKCFLDIGWNYPYFLTIVWKMTPGALIKTLHKIWSNPLRDDKNSKTSVTYIWQRIILLLCMQLAHFNDSGNVGSNAMGEGIDARYNKAQVLFQVSQIR